MTSSNERVFVVGATGNIGSDLVRGLIKKGIDTTAYVRNEHKAKDLFKDELNTGHLKIAVGTHTSVDAFKKAIKGHTRLFLLIAEVMNKPTAMVQIKQTFGKIAYEQGVRQIVDLSSASVTTYGKQGMISYIHMAAEDKLLALADEKPEQRSLVVLRPASFMSNHFMGDVHHIKHSNKFVSCGLPSASLTYIDTKGAEVLTNEQRAAIFTKVLGKSITYEQQSIDDFYKGYIGFGMPHSFVYSLILFYLDDISRKPTPQVSVIIGRPLRTLEDWLKENAQAFQ